MPSRTSAAAAGIRKRNSASYHVVYVREQPQAHPTYLQRSEQPQAHPADLQRNWIRTGDHTINIPHGHVPNGQVSGDFERSPPWFLVYSALTQIEVGILQVHSQGSSPFNTQPVHMWTFMIGKYTNFGAALYYGKCWVMGSRRSKICDIVGSIFGSLASAAFLSILVPRSLEPIVFIVWMLQSLMYIDVARNWIVKVAKRLYDCISNGTVYVWNRIIVSNNEINQPN